MEPKNLIWKPRPYDEPDPDDPTDNIERYTASLDPGKRLKTMGFHAHRPPYTDPDYKGWEYFNPNGLKWTVMRMGPPAPVSSNFEVIVYRAATSSRGVPGYQYIGGFICPVEELGLRLRAALATFVHPWPNVDDNPGDPDLD